MYMYFYVYVYRANLFRLAKLKSQCPRKSKSGKLQKIDFLLTKHIEAYWYGIK